jgi:hypothetical protein
MHFTKSFIYFCLALGGASAQRHNALDNILAARGERMVHKGLELMARNPYAKMPPVRSNCPSDYCSNS